MFYYNELKPILNKISSNSEDLTSIQLSHKKITDKNLLQISDALQTNTTVDEIWLTNNFITEVGSLAGVLERNDQVTEVYLGGNKIGDQGGKNAYQSYEFCVISSFDAMSTQFIPLLCYHIMSPSNSFMYCRTNSKEYHHN
jgi:hypothetical protein